MAMDCFYCPHEPEFLFCDHPELQHYVPVSWYSFKSVLQVDPKRQRRNKKQPMNSVSAFLLDPTDSGFGQKVNDVKLVNVRIFRSTHSTV